MPPQSRGDMKPPPLPAGFQSKSTPNLPTLRALKARDNTSSSVTTKPADHQTLSPDDITSPSEPTSIEDYSLDSSQAPSSDEEEATSDEATSHIASLPPPRRFYHQHSRSHSHLAPSAFYPPFYNRPPTPLPPSPSLTSLLRPNFSSQTSRPGTPDPSSDEGGTPPNPTTTRPGTQTPSSAAASTLTTSFRTAKPIPRASPQVPTYEYYGFTLYLTSSLALIIYLLWSFLPSPFLHQLGLYYYPDRWWALAIPSWVVMGVLYIYVALASYNNNYLTLSLDSVETLVDEAANVAVVDSKGRLLREEKASWQVEGEGRAGPQAKGRPRMGGQNHSRQASFAKGVNVVQELDWRGLWNEGTDAVMDIPVGGVCEILYGRAEG